MRSSDESVTAHRPFMPEDLVHLLRSRASATPEGLAYTFLSDGESEGDRLTYAELDVRAKAVAATLVDRIGSGQRVMLLYPSGVDFVVAFFGCMYAGVIAIPAPPPDPDRINRTVPRLEAIRSDASVSAVLTTTDLATRMAPLAADWNVRWFGTGEIESSAAHDWRAPVVRPDELAYLQYTSGSTSTPKGVMISHANVLSHCRDLELTCGYTPDSVSAVWMPNYHDYGLVEGLLQPLFVGIPSYILSPGSFVQRPARWLEAVSRYRVTHSQGPSFAYGLCVRKSTAAERAGLDLSSWRAAGNAAEPINPGISREFSEMFAPCGFRPTSFCPAYGLAEATLLASFSPISSEPAFYDVEAAALTRHQLVESRSDDGPVRTLVGCGAPVRQTSIEIVHPELRTRCRPGEIGEIWVGSPNIAQGYWERPEESERIFRARIADTGEGPFLRTGDLGVMHGGELVVTGRHKDLLIVRGVNHYPQDIEWSVERSHPAVRPGFCAAFQVLLTGEERLAVAAELGDATCDTAEVIAAIRREVSEAHDLAVHAVVLVEKGSVFKTSSGKVMRTACGEAFLNGQLPVIDSWTSGLVAAGSAISRRQIARARIEPDADLAIRASGPSLPAGTSAGRASDLVGWLRHYAQDRINSRVIDERRCIPPNIILDFGNRGILGMQVPGAYDGIGLSNRDAMRVLEQVAAIDLTLGTFVCVNNYLGIRPVERFAGDALRAELLPSLARGRQLAAFALSEPGAGSNPRAIAAQGVAHPEGGWRLRGTKSWSGPASWASVLNVFVNVDATLDTPGGITGFVLRDGASGVRQGSEALTMGMRGMIQNSVHLEDVRVSEAELLGISGGGMVAAHDAMTFTRLGFGVLSLGGMKRCAQLAHRYAARRTISTGRLLDNPITLLRLSELAASITAVEVLVARIAELLDGGDDVPVDAFVACKTFAPEALWRAADMLVQVLGARGYMEPNIAPQLLRDARVVRIFEGPTETLHMFLGARALGRPEGLRNLIRQAGAPHVLERLEAAAIAVEQRCLGPASPCADRPSAIRFANSTVGQIATLAIVWAFVESERARGETAALARSAEWLRRTFDEAVERGVSGCPAGAAMLDGGGLSDLVSSYAETIGDVEQSMQGPDVFLDPMLRPDPRPGTDTGWARDAGVGHEPVPRPRSSAQVDTERGGAGFGRLGEWIAAWLAEATGIDLHTIDWKQPFTYFGIDSVTAVTLAYDLQDHLGWAVPETVVWKFSTIEELARHLSDQDAPRQHAVEVTTRPDDGLEAVLAELEMLPEEDAAEALERERPSRDPRPSDPAGSPLR